MQLIISAINSGPLERDKGPNFHSGRIALSIGTNKNSAMVFECQALSPTWTRPGNLGFTIDRSRRGRDWSSAAFPICRKELLAKDLWMLNRGIFRFGWVVNSNQRAVDVLWKHVHQIALVTVSDVTQLFCLIF